MSPLMPVMRLVLAGGGAQVAPDVLNADSVQVQYKDWGWRGLGCFLTPFARAAPTSMTPELVETVAFLPIRGFGMGYTRWHGAGYRLSLWVQE